MLNEIKEWVKSCSVCQSHSRKLKSKEGKMAPIVATRPFQILGMDILTGLPTTNAGNRSVVLFTDYYTKWVEAFAIPNEQALTVAQKLIQGILCRHGAPERIISDRGTQFTADVFREVTDLLGMKQSMTSGYHPQADGQAERNIGTLTRTLSKLSGANQSNWDVLIPYALWAHRTATHAVTRETPFFLVYGRQATNPSDVRIKQWMEEHQRVENYTKEVAQRLLEAQSRVIEATNKAKAYDKQRFDAGRVDSTYKVGDIVWLEVEKAPTDQNRKLSPTFEGHYRVSKLLEGEHDLNVEITHTNNSNDIRNVNIRKLKRVIFCPEDVELIPKEVKSPISPKEVTQREVFPKKKNPLE